jgi:cell division protein FtsN
VSDSRPADVGAPPVGGVVALALLALLLSGLVSAQGLGTAADRERERREKVKSPPAKVFTNDDLPGAPEDEAAASESAEDDAEGEALPTEESADPVREELDREREKRAALEQQWRTRFAEARAWVDEAEARCWQEVVRTEYYNGIPVQMKVQEFVESEEFRQAKQALADLREEFRRTGLPPGWARE